MPDGHALQSNYEEFLLTPGVYDIATSYVRMYIPLTELSNPHCHYYSVTQSLEQGFFYYILTFEKLQKFTGKYLSAIGMELITFRGEWPYCETRNETFPEI
ncbi:MAG TPA: hypothetical protein VM935_18275 [Chitinophagaceae bacterium]|nr:hypothetical protein [Chitinophagaceae bacterium]